MFKRKNNILFTVIILAIFFGKLDIAMAQNNWEETRDEEGIQIFQRDDGNRINDFRVDFIVSSTIDGAVRFLMYEKGMKDLIDNIKKVSLIKKVSDSVRYYYINVAVDPFINRDAITKVMLSRQNENKVFYEMKLDSTLNYKLDHKSVMPFEIRWVLERISEGSVYVKMHYSAQVDEYYEFVYGIIEELLSEQLFNMAEKMKENVSKPFYQESY